MLPNPPRRYTMKAMRKAAISLALALTAGVAWVAWLRFEEFWRTPDLPAPAPREAIRTDPGPTNPRPIDPLVDAAQEGNLSRVEALLARKPGRASITAALFAAAYSEPLVLGEGGAKEVDATYARIAALLLQHGASPRARDESGMTPLIVASGHGETAVVRLLLDNGADIEAVDHDGRTALIAAACECFSIDMPDTADSMRILLDHGANIAPKDKEGATALLVAAGWGRAANIELLLDRGADIDATDIHGETALHIASSGHAYPTADAIKALLKRGADLEAKNRHGLTALDLARKEGNREAVALLKAAAAKAR